MPYTITVNGAPLLSNVAYEPFGPVRGWTWGNATQETHLYNTDGNPSEISALETTNYTEDSAFRITARPFKVRPTGSGPRDRQNTPSSAKNDTMRSTSRLLNAAEIAFISS